MGKRVASISNEQKQSETLADLLSVTLRRNGKLGNYRGVHLMIGAVVLSNSQWCQTFGRSSI